MAEFLVAGAVGLVLALRWPVGVWIAGAFAVVVGATLMPGSPGAVLITIVGSILAYNAGLVAGIVVSEILHRARPTGRLAGTL